MRVLSFQPLIDVKNDNAEVLVGQCILDRRPSFGMLWSIDPLSGKIRHFGSLEELQGLCHEPGERNERTWACRIVQRLDQRLTRSGRQAALLGQISQFNQADRRNMNEIARCRRPVSASCADNDSRESFDRYNDGAGIGNDTRHQISSLGKLRHISP